MIPICIFMYTSLSIQSLIHISLAVSYFCDCDQSTAFSMYKEALISGMCVFNVDCEYKAPLSHNGAL